MSARLKPAEQTAFRRMSGALRQDAVQCVRWEALVLAQLEHGPSTRIELAALIRVKYTEKQRCAINDAIRRLVGKGKVRERPMIEPAGRAVRVVPVTVVERVEPRPEGQS